MDYKEDILEFFKAKKGFIGAKEVKYEATIVSGGVPQLMSFKFTLPMIVVMHQITSSLNLPDELLNGNTDYVVIFKYKDKVISSSSDYFICDEITIVNDTSQNVDYTFYAWGYELKKEKLR